MNGGPLAERVYEALRRRILENGFRPGARLDPAELAGELASSVTPVRDALHRLVGEALVETRTGGGFHLPLVDEPGLADLYGWHAELLLAALRRGADGARLDGQAPGRLDGADLAERARHLFARLAASTPNIEHRRALGSVGARLHAARRLEPAVLSGVEAEIEAIEAAAADRASLRRLIQAYHRRRIRTAAAIVRALYRGG